jgi:Holliday junction resolvase
MSRGLQRERAVRDWLQARDWIVIRAAGSLGDFDLIALKSCHTPLIIEVKSTHRGPFHSFGPQERATLKQVAEWAGAIPVLAWWPPHGKLTWIYEDDWPPAAAPLRGSERVLLFADDTAERSPP